MNSTQLDPGLSAMLAGTNLSIDPGALLQQQPLFETDTASSRTTSTSSLPRFSAPDTPDTEDDDGSEEDEEEEEEDDTPKKPTTRSKAKMPTKSRTATTSSKSKRGAAATTSTTGTADKRRRRNLERNRAAASKCRQRKKQWQDGLERKKIELESRYKALHGETKQLMEEVAQLKNVVMGHAACNDANIDDWIRNEADNFVRRMSGAQMHLNAQTTPPVSAATGPMAQMQSPTQGHLTAPPAMNGMYMTDWGGYTPMSNGL